MRFSVTNVRTAHAVIRNTTYKQRSKLPLHSIHASSIILKHCMLSMLNYCYCYYYYYYTSTRKVRPVSISMRQEMTGFCDAVASARPYANNLNLASNRWPHQHIAQFLQSGCSSWRPTNSVKALKATCACINESIIQLLIYHINCFTTKKTQSSPNCQIYGTYMS